MERKDIFKWSVVALAVVIVLIGISILIYWGVETSNIVTYNIKREVVQHSQQYVETKVNLLNKLYSDWEELRADISEIMVSPASESAVTTIIEAKEAQQKAIVLRIKTEANMIPEGSIPAEIRQFIETH